MDSSVSYIEIFSIFGVLDMGVFIRYGKGGGVETRYHELIWHYLLMNKSVILS